MKKKTPETPYPVPRRISRDLTNLFIWSAFRYYLRQPSDSYVVYSPSKYFKSQGLIDRKFLDGFMFNRKRFHATKDAGVSCIQIGRAHV